MPSLPISKLIRFNRIISWTLVVVSVLVIFFGYAIAREILPFIVFSPIHLTLEIIFVGILITHLIITLIIPAYWIRQLQKIRAGTATSITWIKLGQRITGWIIVIFAGLVILSGLDWYGLGLNAILPFEQHLNVDIFLIISIAIHLTLGLKVSMNRMQIKGPGFNAVLLSGLVLTTIFLVSWDSSTMQGIIAPPGQNELDGEYSSPPPIVPGIVTIDGQLYEVNATQVETIRPDLFKPDFFSLFDVLVWLDGQQQIELEYHFNDTLNAHIIDSLNGHPYWWYWAFYDGGWAEQNVFRMDHYPWKDGTTLYVYKTTDRHVKTIYDVWAEEITRKNANGGLVIIPEVIIRGPGMVLTFENIVVTPHNLRNDIFQDDVITAIDIILSMGDQGLITYSLQWYETIGTAGPIQSYWVEAINEKVASGGCGFVYETGDNDFQGFIGNHIHIPSDTRIINSPEYNLWYWICLGGIDPGP